MNHKEKGRVGWHQATRDTSVCDCKSTGFAPHIKSAIVALGSRGLLPRRVAELLIQHGGLRHV